MTLHREKKTPQVPRAGIHDCAQQPKGLQPAAERLGKVCSLRILCSWLSGACHEQNEFSSLPGLK